MNVYKYDSSDGWVYKQVLTPTTSDPDNSRYGESVALSDDGEVLVTGAWSYDTASYDYGGSRANAGQV